MNINKIINLCIVVEEGSMAKAAEKLFCSQPALTKQIHSLEEELGCPLFLRRGKKWSSTTTGGRSIVLANPFRRNTPI